MPQTKETFITDKNKLTLKDKYQLISVAKLSSLKRKNKVEVRAFKNSLIDIKTLLNTWFKMGKSSKILTYSHSWITDKIILCIWKINASHLTHKQNITTYKNIAVFATGGYGRHELHLHSDIDILFLGENIYINNENNKIIIEKFISLLWDIGLKISQSIRTVNECLTLATKDIKVMILLMEARLLTGDTDIAKQLINKIHKKKIWTSKKYLKKLRKDHDARHSKFNQNSCHLEPSVKYSPGGLRDIHLLQWLSLYFHQTNELDDLVKKNLLRANEKKSLIEARDFLWFVRWALHYICQQNEERLLFDHQIIIAKFFGIKHSDNNIVIERFMKIYFKKINDANTVKEILLQHYYENVITNRKKKSIIYLNDRFCINSKYLQVINNATFKQHPESIMEMFMIMAYNKNIIGVNSSTIRILKDNLNLIDNNFRINKKTNSFFLQIFTSPYDISPTITQMANYGVLGKYLPEFEFITGQVQFNLFHAYTVDAHTLQVIRNLCSFIKKPVSQDLSIIHNIMKNLKSHEILYISALYHDIAKGMNGDHSKVGAKMAYSFCNQHSIDKKQKQLICWLVENHLLLSVTAQRSDLTDIKEFHLFAKKVKTIQKLNYLYCLTIADVIATNEKLWNSWRSSLFSILYTETKKILIEHSSMPSRDMLISQRIEKSINILDKNNVNIDKAKELWLKFDSEYFIRYSADEILWHTKALIKKRKSEKAFAIARNEYSLSKIKSTSIFVYTTNPSQSFALITRSLENLNLNILEAKVIVNSNDSCISTFIVLEFDNSIVPANSHRMASVCKKLNFYTNNQSDILKSIYKLRIPRLLRYFYKKPKINFTIDTENNRTKIEIFAIDRPGLLAVITNVFYSFNIVVQNAKIFTLGEKVEDIFFVTTLKKFPLNQNTQAKICKKLEKIIVIHTSKDRYYL